LERDATGAPWLDGPLSVLAVPAEVHVWRVGLEARGSAGREAARRALRILLARYLGEDGPEAIELALGPRGKPRLADRPERLAFNLSHSGALALVAVGVGAEVGVDVERLRPRRDLAALARRVLAPAAVAAVEAAPAERREAVFYAAWTRHEARVKCLGGGLGAPPTEEPVALSTLAPGPGYAGAVAVAGSEQPRLRLWDFAWG
jgi:4'-phosphopantetheinyl transferase